MVVPPCGAAPRERLGIPQGRPAGSYEALLGGDGPETVGLGLGNRCPSLSPSTDTHHLCDLGKQFTFLSLDSLLVKWGC